MSVIIDFSIFPMDKGTKSLSPYVARAVTIVRDSGLPYQLGPMGTAIEGEWEEVMQVIDKCYKELEPDSDRIYMNIKVDSRRDRTDGLKSKTASVTEKISKP